MNPDYYLENHNILGVIIWFWYFKFM